jgi:SAICAR synthetase
LLGERYLSEIRVPVGKLYVLHIIVARDNATISANDLLLGSKTLVPDHCQSNQRLMETFTDGTLDGLKLLSRGKVRNVYETSDPNALLFVATDRISAYDVILNNVCTVLIPFCI